MNRDALAFFDLGTEPWQDESVKTLFSEENVNVGTQVLNALGEQRNDVLYKASLSLSGRQRSVDIVINPILDGKVYIGSMIIINDRTEQEKMLEQMALSEKLASIGLLSAGVAHEINNPLETICNYVDFLKLKVHDAGLSNTIERLEEEVTSIEHIVGNLIAFSEDRAVEVERLDIVDLVDTLAALILPNAKKRGIELDIAKPGQKIIIQANRTEIKQVALNLMKNALDAMPDGGQMRIELAAEDSGGVDWAVLRVEDTGCGLPDGTKSNMFIPFFSTKSQSEGHMGLGLSIIYGIVLRLRGNITAENTVPHGCRFTVKIPM